MSRKVFGPKKEKIIGRWRNLHSEELYDLKSSPDILKVTKSRRMKWAGSVEQRRM
jgi:hypothetical protein